MEPPRRRPRGPKGLLRFVTLAGSLLSLVWLSPLEAPTAAVAIFAKGKNKKVLVQYKGFELLLFKGKGKVPIPSLKLQKIPLKPLSLGAAGSVESSMSIDDLQGFPFTTKNSGTLKIGFPRIAGRLQLRYEDPPRGADIEDAQPVLEASYEQKAAGGEVAGKVRSNGEWSASFGREVEDVGHLRGGMNSVLDWNVDLDTSYAPVLKGRVTPTVSYGATQDGMRVHARADGYPAKGVKAFYAVQNIPGKYAPADFLHNAQVTASSADLKHTVEAAGSYDRKFPKLPVRGSLKYVRRTRPATMEASVDFERYRLRARSNLGEVTAAVGRTADENGGRPAELELRAGKVAAVAMLEPGSSKPRMRLDIGL
mmetsp:Transcript_71462/g.115296  ORF Transcript_71462/g.115296 Transcript_71462/m.115296 type:complete len:367 (+) Transcript_71462:94-1194(+)